MQLLEARSHHSSKCIIAGWILLEVATWIPVGA